MRIGSMSPSTRRATTRCTAGSQVGVRFGPGAGGGGCFVEIVYNVFFCVSVGSFLSPCVVRYPQQQQLVIHNLIATIPNRKDKFTIAGRILLIRHRVDQITASNRELRVLEPSVHEGSCLWLLHEVLRDLFIHIYTRTYQVCIGTRQHSIIERRSWMPLGYLLDTSWIPLGYLLDTLDNFLPGFCAMRNIIL